MTHPVIIVNSHLATVQACPVSLLVQCTVLTIVLSIKLLPVCIRFKLPTAAAFLHFVKCLVSVSPASVAFMCVIIARQLHGFYRCCKWALVARALYKQVLLSQVHNTTSHHGSLAAVL